MKTIFITISRGSIIRNFFHTGVISRIIDNNCRVVILTPYYQNPELFSLYQHPNLLIEPLILPQRLKAKKIFDEFFKGVIFSKQVHARYKYRFSGAQPNKLFYLPRLILFVPWSFVPGFKKLIRLLDYWCNPQYENDYLFKKYNPDLIFTTSASDYVEAGLLKSAKRFKVRSICMPKSWDNLSKILFAGKADYMLVWSLYMKEQAIRFQDYKSDQIIIVGVPQFDLYTRKENLIPRNEFFRKFNFDVNKKLILYGSAGRISSEDAYYVKLIKQFIDEGKLADVQILVRPHIGYLNDRNKFASLKKHKGITIDHTDIANDKLKDHWDISYDHCKNLFSSLYYADVCINMVSTLTLDAIACGTPVININFDIAENTDLKNSTKRIYMTDFIGAITSKNATWVVSTKDEFLQALKNILEKGEKREKETEEFIDYFIYKTDGQSAERIANSLIKLID